MLFVNARLNFYLPKSMRQSASNEAAEWGSWLCSVPLQIPSSQGPLHTMHSDDHM